MSTLDSIYAAITQSQTTGTPLQLPELEHHSVHYARFLVEDKLNIKLTLEEAKHYLYEEGLLPDEYYFSKEYIQKWKHIKVNNTGYVQDLERQPRVQRSDKALKG